MKRVLGALALGVVALALLPAAGLWAGYTNPPGLVSPPPTTLARIVPLFARTLALAVCVTAISCLLGTWLAWVEQRCSYRGARLLALLSLLVMAVPSYLLASILREVLAPGGALGAALGVQRSFTGFLPAVVVLSLVCTPYVHLLVGAAVRRLPTDAEEAARSLGATPRRRFEEVIFPALRPALVYAALIVALYVVSDFGAVAVLDCEVLTWELYKAQGAEDAARIGFGLMALVVPMIAGARLIHRRAHVSRDGAPRPPSQHRLSGSALVATYGVHALVIGLGVLLPVVTLASWLIAGIRYDAPFAPIWAPLRDTLVFSLAGTALCTMAAMIPAWVVAHDRNPRSALIEHGAYLTSGLPGVLIAVSVLQLFLSLRRSVETDSILLLESAGLLLMLGYVMGHLKEGYAALKPPILRLDPRQDEVARSLGAPRFRRLLRIRLPQLAPGVAAATLLLFLALIKELPITLLLTPLGHSTLAYRIFDAQKEASLPDVGLAGLTLVALALCMQLLVNRWRQHG